MFWSFHQVGLNPFSTLGAVGRRPDRDGPEASRSESRLSSGRVESSGSQDFFHNNRVPGVRRDPTVSTEEWTDLRELSGTPERVLPEVGPRLDLPSLEGDHHFPHQERIFSSEGRLRRTSVGTESTVLMCDCGSTGPKRDLEIQTSRSNRQPVDGNAHGTRGGSCTSGQEE